jgi:hypothetical protein
LLSVAEIEYKSKLYIKWLRVYIHYVSKNLGSEIFLCNNTIFNLEFIKGGIKKIVNDQIEKAKADIRENWLILD